jgi:MoaA/NifB/PqqE/SkfB family radical SAM enzyme
MFSLGVIEANLEHVLRLREQTNWPLDVQVNYVVQPENVAEVNQFMRRWSGRVDRVNLLRLTSQSALRSEALGTLAPCYMARTKLYVSVNGGIYPCFRTSLPIEPLGLLRDVSIGEVWRLRRAAAAADPTSLLTPLCHRCTYNPEPWEPMIGKRL